MFHVSYLCGFQTCGGGNPTWGHILLAKKIIEMDGKCVTNIFLLTCESLNVNSCCTMVVWDITVDRQMWPAVLIQKVKRYKAEVKNPKKWKSVSSEHKM